MDFDRHAGGYEEELRRGLRWSGSGPEWFAERRIEFVQDRLRRAGVAPRCIIYFGCGVGNHIPLFRRAFPGCRMVGIDISPVSLRIAEERHGGPDARFCPPEDYPEREVADLVYLNGVLHHIPSQSHATQLGYLAGLLQPGGWLAIFDNNPLSLPARLVMRSISFDRDAVMVSPYRLARSLPSCGFANPQVDFHFIFPRPMGFLRRFEPRLTRWPLGAQYSVIARKEAVQ